jgi:Immunoglobulin domain/Right handed beta helix region
MPWNKARHEPDQQLDMKTRLNKNIGIRTSSLSPEGTPGERHLPHWGKFVSPCILIAALLAGFPRARAQTTAGLITNTQLWSGTIQLSGDITIGPGGQVTIQPGTVVKAVPKQDSTSGGTNVNLIEIIVDQGTLLADGRGGAAITFTSAAASPQPADWYGIRFKSGAMTLGNCAVQYAHDGLTLEGGGTLVNDACTFEHNDDNGIYVKVPGVFEFANLQVSNNGWHGLSVGRSVGSIELTGVVSTNNPQDGLYILRDARISNAQLSANKYDGIYCSGTLSVDASTINNDGSYGLDIYGATITGCTITANGSDGINGGGMTIMGCTINYNQGNGISGGTLSMSNDTVRFNADNGVSSGANYSSTTVSRCNISNNGSDGFNGGGQFTGCVIKNNTTGIEAGSVSVADSLISGNSDAGIKVTDYGSSGGPFLAGGITNNVIDSNGIGLDVNSQNSGLTLAITNNDITNNVVELKDSGLAAINASGNFWGEPTTTELQTGVVNLSKIDDHHDDASVGLVTIATWSATDLFTPPQITAQPQSITVTNGGNAVFSVTASGSAPLMYQWTFNGAPMLDAGLISGANSSSLTIFGVMAANAGNYAVQVMNPAGSVASQTATLTVGQAVLYHPADNNPADMQISLNEAIAYASAWKKGATWPIPPNPIPIGYMTRAASIWKSGEYYKYDPSLGDPPLCWVNTGKPGKTIRAVGGQDAGLSATAGIATSTMASACAAGQSSQVRITASPPPGTIAYALEDQVPAGWTVSNINEDGAFDSVAAKVKWGPFFDALPRTLTYRVTAPKECPGTARFHGTASFDGMDVTVTGRRTILVSSSAEGGGQLIITSPRYSGPENRFSVSVPTAKGTTYTLESRDSLDTGEWQPVQSVAGTGGVVVLSDTSASKTCRFYRVEAR